MRFLLFLMLIISCNPAKVPTKYVDYVDPFIGTGGHGHTFPGSCLPFGMIQISPDTRLTGWDGCSAYHYSDSLIYGFSHTHLSGTGVSDYGDLLMMPHSNKNLDIEDYRAYHSSFDKKTESASPNYYSVILDKHNIEVELTSSLRSGIHRYHFPKDSVQFLMINLEHRDKLLEGQIELIDDRSIRGKRISSAWAEKQHFYFYIEFSKPYTLSDSKYNSEHHVHLNFDNNDTPLLAYVGMSAVSEEGAQKNAKAEILNKQFEQIKLSGIEKWEKELSKIEVEGAQKYKKIFYTALYHSFIAPNLFTDVDGQFRGTDGKIHQTDSDYYTIFSLWDTFRATHPLYTLTQRKRSLDFIKTFLMHYKKGGKLPVWELAGNYTGCMIGYHAVSVIADAFMKGITDFDHQLALEAMTHSAEKDHLGLSFYKDQGFIGFEDEAESVSKTLEYAYDDWCIAQFAHQLKADSIANLYYNRALNYRNLFDPESGFIRAKSNGSWYAPFNPREVNFNYTEANGWQYNFFGIQDIEGMIKTMGGDSVFDIRLDSMFESSSEMEGRDQVDITGLIGQYAHGNEPSHHVAYLYNYVGKPWKTQFLCRKILSELYTDKPDGLSGNEDCGQMSSWFVLSALGLYALDPGSSIFNIGSPLFSKITFHLENGNTFKIEVDNQHNDHPYVQRIHLNNSLHNKTFIDYKDILNGGHMKILMSSEPNFERAIQKEDRPPSNIDDKKFVPSPYFNQRQKTFKDQMNLEIFSICEDCSIFYSINDGEFKLYENTLKITAHSKIKAYSVNSQGDKSKMIKGQYMKIDDRKRIEILQPYASQYAAGGDQALIDHLTAGLNFRTGLWQGFQHDLEVIIDLGAIQDIHAIKIGMLQDIRSWIFFPPTIEISIAASAGKFKTIKKISHELPTNDYTPKKNNFSYTFPNAEKGRYVKVYAKNFGKCPDWHLGAGGQSWLFADEIIIE